MHRHILFLSCDRACADHRVAVAADHRRPAWADSPFGRCIAVSELRKNVYGCEFRAVCNHSLDFKQGQKARSQANFGSGTRGLMGVLGVMAVAVLARFVWVQTVKADSILVRPSLVMQADGVRRYQYNPRLLKSHASCRRVPSSTVMEFRWRRAIGGRLKRIAQNTRSWGLCSTRPRRRLTAGFIPWARDVLPAR